jgi:hypothetical protein
MFSKEKTARDRRRCVYSRRILGDGRQAFPNRQRPSYWLSILAETKIRYLNNCAQICYISGGTLHVKQCLNGFPRNREGIHEEEIEITASSSRDATAQP